MHFLTREFLIGNKWRSNFAENQDRRSSPLPTFPFKSFCSYRPIWYIEHKSLIRCIFNYSSLVKTDLSFSSILECILFHANLISLASILVPDWWGLYLLNLMEWILFFRSSITRSFFSESKLMWMLPLEIFTNCFALQVNGLLILSIKCSR